MGQHPWGVQHWVRAALDADLPTPDPWSKGCRHVLWATACFREPSFTKAYHICSVTTWSVKHARGCIQNLLKAQLYFGGGVQYLTPTSKRKLLWWESKCHADPWVLTRVQKKHSGCFRIEVGDSLLCSGPGDEWKWFNQCPPPVSHMAPHDPKRDSCSLLESPHLLRVTVFSLFTPQRETETERHTQLQIERDTETERDELGNRSCSFWRWFYTNKPFQDAKSLFLPGEGIFWTSPKLSAWANLPKDVSLEKPVSWMNIIHVKLSCLDQPDCVYQPQSKIYQKCWLIKMSKILFQFGTHSQLSQNSRNLATGKCTMHKMCITIFCQFYLMKGKIKFEDVWCRTQLDTQCHLVRYFTLVSASTEEI